MNNQGGDRVMRIFQRAFAASAMMLASAAQAQPIVIADSGDNGWMLAASLLILVAILPGLTLFQTRSPNSRTTVGVIGATAMAMLLLSVVGYSLAFSEGTGLLGGLSNTMLAGLTDVQPDMTISGSIYALFEISIALVAMAILVASIAEKTPTGWLLAFAALWIMIVYIPVAHWVWGGGWIAGLGGLDYSGGIVVQTTAGISSLVISLLVGREHEIAASDEAVPAGAGSLLIWVGWLTIIGGSSFAATGDAADAMINGLLAASASVLTGLMIERFRTGSFTAHSMSTSAIAGLAAVSAGAGFIGPAGAICIGILGALCAWLAMILVRTLKVGSASSAFVIYGGSAISGAILFPVFVLPTFGGPGLDEGITLGGQLMTQAVAVVAVVLWTAIATCVAALMISMVLPMTARGEDRR
jgi:ammonium transporter, Amt family